MITVQGPIFKGEMAGRQLIYQILKFAKENDITADVVKVEIEVVGDYDHEEAQVSLSYVRAYTPEEFEAEQTRIRLIKEENEAWDARWRANQEADRLKRIQDEKDKIARKELKQQRRAERLKRRGLTEEDCIQMEEARHNWYRTTQGTYRKNV